MRRPALFPMALLAIALGVPVCAQWIKYPTPGIPRTADGKANLTALAPKTAEGKPDLSGIWRIDAVGYAANVTADLKPDDILPWAQALYKQRLDTLGADNPESRCLPPGPAIGLFGELQKIIQTPELMAILNEHQIFRQVFTDGRKLPEDPSPAWQGYSIGRWESDTLVVETAGFNDRSWLDYTGHPHTEALRLTERYRRKDFGHMELRVTFDDPKTYVRPWTIAAEMFLAADTELLEFVCNENERDAVHEVGKLSDGRAPDVKVPRETLAKYVGSYRAKSLAMDLGVALSASGVLTLDINGKGATEMLPISATRFLSPNLGGEIEFGVDGQGKATHLVLVVVEGDFKAERK